jgi:hypothetical protein
LADATYAGPIHASPEDSDQRHRDKVKQIKEEMAIAKESKKPEPRKIDGTPLRPDANVRQVWRI